MKSLLKFLLPLFFIATLAVQCDKDDESDPNEIIDFIPPQPTDTLYMSDELKSYFYFPKDSWWVYKRTDTNALIYDTARVVRIINEIFYSNFAPYAWEKITHVTEHTYYKSLPNSVSPHLAVSFSNLNALVDRIDITSGSTFLGGLDCVISTPIDSIHIKGLQCNVWSNLDSISSLNLAGRNFNNVLNISYGRNPTTDRISIVSGVGILKYNCIQCGHTWELVSYDIK